jgi:hypothetical protein
MNLVKVYFRLIYTFFSIIIIFASLMLWVENDNIQKALEGSTGNYSI